MTDVSILKRGVEEILPESEFDEGLASGKTLKVKAGFDPTAPDIHLGHTVLLNKMRQFQDMGHQVDFVIGDFTGMIGDPTGKNAARPPMKEDEILANAETYKEQAFKVLKPEQTNVVFNSTWLKELGSAGMIKLAASATVARMLERDDFSKRYKANTPIAIHEFLYPLIQGYDSVALDSDIELGGTDQKFNLLMGRELQKQHGQKPQQVMMLPLLEGLDGVNKMSKSLNNYIGITESPTEMFGKIMSISDELMWRYFDLLSFLPTPEIQKFKEEVDGGKNPRDIKFELAKEIITRFHSSQDAQGAQQEFIERFAQGALPTDLEETIVTVDGSIGLPILLKDLGLVKSTSEAIRMIKQGAVKIDGNKVEDKDLQLKPGDTGIFQVGKRRFAKVSMSAQRKPDKEMF